MNLNLIHGEVELPNFFFDATRGSVRAVDTTDLDKAMVPGLVMNTFHLISSLGINTVRSMEGLNNFTGWKGPILTDSGGFQVFSLISENPKFGEIRDNEVIYRPENKEKKIILTPEKSIQMQLACKSDIVMCFDYCTSLNESAEINMRSVKTTISWAARSKTEFIKLTEKDRSEKRLLFAIIQGGGDFRLRKYCADSLKQIGFDGYGFGGWPLDHKGLLAEDILRYTAELMEDGKPKYAMGVGKPEEIVKCVRMGYNLFDCVIPTREARHNRLMVFDADNISDIDVTKEKFYHYYYIMDEKYRKDARSISNSCDCHLCRNYSRSYLRYLFKIGDSLAYRLATIHNVRFYTLLMEKIREQMGYLYN